jgi:hypothetical protein
MNKLCGLQGLKNHYSIICLNDDKEMINPEGLDEDTLAEMMSIASPSLILIPKGQVSIIMSASSQYTCICLYKDIKKL